MNEGINMRTVQKTVFLFDELSDAAKEKARDWYRQNGMDYEWWDGVYADAKQVADIIGIDIDDIRFSGFSSQGDGASFVGSYRYKKGALKAIKEYAPNDDELHHIAKELQTIQKRNFYALWASVYFNGCYCHSGTMSASVEDKRNQYGQCSNADDETELQDVLRCFADWIYSQLEKEYEGLCLDDAIAYLGYEFDENGAHV